MIEPEHRKSDRPSQMEITIHDGIITSTDTARLSPILGGEINPNEEEDTFCEMICQTQIPYATFIFYS